MSKRQAKKLERGSQKRATHLVSRDRHSYPTNDSMLEKSALAEAQTSSLVSLGRRNILRSCLELYGIVGEAGDDFINRVEKVDIKQTTTKNLAVLANLQQLVELETKHIQEVVTPIVNLQSFLRGWNIRQSMPLMNQNTAAVWQAMMNSEKFYFRQIDKIFSIYQAPLLEMATSGDLGKITKHDILDAFPSREILQTSREILTKLDKANEHFPVLPNCGILFSNLTVPISNYVSYAKEVGNIMESLRNLELLQIPKFNTFLAKSRDVTGVSLADLIYHPLKQVSKYEESVSALLATIGKTLTTKIALRTRTTRSISSPRPASSRRSLSSHSRSAQYTSNPVEGISSNDIRREERRKKGLSDSSNSNHHITEICVSEPNDAPLDSFRRTGSGRLSQSTPALNKDVLRRLGSGPSSTEHLLKPKVEEPPQIQNPPSPTQPSPRLVPSSPRSDGSASSSSPRRLRSVSSGGERTRISPRRDDMGDSVALFRRKKSADEEAGSDSLSDEHKSPKHSAEKLVKAGRRTSSDKTTVGTLNLDKVRRKPSLNTPPTPEKIKASLADPSKSVTIASAGSSPEPPLRKRQLHTVQVDSASVSSRMEALLQQGDPSPTKLRKATPDSLHRLQFQNLQRSFESVSTATSRKDMQVAWIQYIEQELTPSCRDDLQALWNARKELIHQKNAIAKILAETSGHQQLLERIESLDEYIDLSQTKLLREGNLTFMKSERSYFLFSDYFLLAKHSKSKRKMAVKGCWAFKELVCHLEESDSLETFSFSFYRKSDPKSKGLVSVPITDSTIFELFKERIDTNSTQVFGVELSILSTREGHPAIPAVITQLCEFILLQKDKAEEGIFRKGGNDQRIDQYKQIFDEGESLPSDADLYVACDLVKLFFRLLPSPLMTYELYWPLLQLVDNLSANPITETAKQMKALIETIPRVNQQVLEYLLRFLDEVSSWNATTKMGVPNLSLVFSVNILKPPPADSAQAVFHVTGISEIVQFMITNWKAIFHTTTEESEVRESRTENWIVQFRRFSAQQISLMSQMEETTTRLKKKKDFGHLTKSENEHMLLESIDKSPISSLNSSSSNLWPANNPPANVDVKEKSEGEESIDSLPVVAPPIRNRAKRSASMKFFSVALEQDFKNDPPEFQKGSQGTISAAKFGAIFGKKKKEKEKVEK